MKIEYDGSNGPEIVAALGETVSSRELQISETYGGDALSIDLLYPDGQVSPDRWRVPVGYSLDTETGQVTNKEGVPQDYDTLVQVS